MDEGGKLISNGGRVLSATGLAPSLSESLEASYQIIGASLLMAPTTVKNIGFKGTFGLVILILLGP